MPTFSIIIVNFNAGAYLKRCIDAVLSQDITDFEIILIDNASTDGSLDTVPEDPRIRLITSPENVGFAKANNMAAVQANAPWLALLNPDAFPEKQWLSAALAAFSHYPDVKMFGSTQISAEHPELLDGCGDLYHCTGLPIRGNYRHPISDIPDTGEVFGPCGAGAFYRKDSFLQVGGFDERFFCYCEDVDLAFRLRLTGERCIQLKDAVIHHVGSGITNRSSGFSRRLGTRNLLWLFMKNMPLPFLLLLLPLHAALHAVLLTTSIFTGGFSDRASGLWEGVTHLFPIIVSRGTIQSSRTISLSQLWKSFTLSPFTVLRRRHDVRPL